jgi:CrcB protein
MARFLWICLGGAAGTGVRYLVGLWAARALGTSFPYGTLVVNVAGCFSMAAIMYAATTVASFPETVRLALTTGFMGGLTTYSSFNYETTRFFEDRALGSAVLYVGVTLVLCFVSGLLGVATAQRLVGHS